MISQGDSFYCKACDYRVSYGESGFFKASQKEKLFFDNTADWNYWQKAQLENKIKNLAKEELIFTDKEAILLKGGRLHPLKLYSIGSIELYKDRLMFLGNQGKKVEFNLNKIHGLNIQYNRVFEFYYEGSLYRFTFKHRVTSVYKWVEAINITRGNI